jgi:hypothetical protein
MGGWCSSGEKAEVIRRRGALASTGVLLVLVLSPVFPANLEAQLPRGQMLVDWERHRGVVAAYAAAMPEEHLDFRPTPEVRTFAEQIEHVVRDNVRIVAMAFGRDDLPDPGAREHYLSSSDALVAHVHQAYDWVIGIIGEASAEELQATVVLFDRIRVPAWRALEGAREHATWTLGQTVPYLRLNGVEPPSYPVFDPTEEIGGRR